MSSSYILSDNGASSGSAGIKQFGGNDGVLLLQTSNVSGTPTTAISISNTQVVTYTNQPTYTGGTANGVLYLNGSKAVTSGTALVFDGANLGVGVTPSAWNAGGKILEVGSSGSILFGQSTAVGLTQNAYYSSGWKYALTNFASYYEQYQGKHIWYTAASGTAGDAISFTQAMTLDASGRLGIGVTSPGALLHIYSGTQEQIRLGRSTTGSSGYLTFYANNTSSAQVQYAGILGDVTSSTAGAQSGALVFYTANAGTVAERARIDSSGNMTITGTVKPSAILSFNGTTVETNPDNAFPTAGASLSYTLAYGPTSNDGHILGMSWSNPSQYGAQLWFDTDPTYQAAFRQRSNVGVWNSWSYLYHSNNYKVYTDTATGGISTSQTRASVTISLNSSTNKILVFGSDLLRCSSGFIRGIVRIDGTDVEGEFMYQQVNGNIWQTTTGIYTGTNITAGSHTVSLYAAFAGGAGAWDGPTYFQVVVWDGI